MPNSFQLPIEIQHMINEILENWCHKNYRITVESFKRKTDYLILFQIGNWNEDKYFFKTAISVKHNDERSFKQLLVIFSLLTNFSHHSA